MGEQRLSVPTYARSLRGAVNLHATLTQLVNALLAWLGEEHGLWSSPQSQN
jgi:hypothetical protein